MGLVLTLVYLRSDCKLFPPILFMFTYMLTNLLFQAKFTVTKSEDEEDALKDTYIIECEGIGMKNPNL